MRTLRGPMLAGGLLVVVLSGCARDDAPEAPPQPQVRRQQPPAAKYKPAQKLYKGSLPEAGPAQLTILAAMS